MPAVAAKPKAEKQIQMRIQAQVRDLIDQAASALGKSRSEFMIEVARDRALDVLLDQRAFRLDAAQWDALSDALSSPPRPNAALKALMKSPAPWA